MKKINAAQIPESQHFCILPWIHTHMNQNGKLYPCCRVDQTYEYGSLKENSFEEIWNGEPVRALRRSLIQDSPFPNCAGCYRTEKAGGVSLRRSVNKDYEDVIGKMLDLTHEDGTLASKELLYLDLRFSNICNFKCRSCNPGNSTSWYQDYEAMTGKTPAESILKPIPPESLWLMLDQLLPKVRRIYFAGGEPLLNEDHYLLLERLIAQNRTDVILSYNTNLSKLSFGKWNVLDLWRQFKSVQIAASLDGAGAPAELIRKGMNWAETLKNFKKIKENLPEVLFYAYPTISVMNSFHITSAIETWLEAGILGPKSQMDFNILNHPFHLNINIMNRLERARLAEHYRAFMKNIRPKTCDVVFKNIEDKLNFVLNSFSDEVWSHQRDIFRLFTFKMDKIRNEKFIGLFPELTEMLYLREDYCAEDSNPADSRTV